MPAIKDDLASARLTKTSKMCLLPVPLSSMSPWESRNFTRRTLLAPSKILQISYDIRRKSTEPLCSLCSLIWHLKHEQKKSIRLCFIHSLFPISPSLTVPPISHWLCVLFVRSHGQMRTPYTVRHCTIQLNHCKLYTRFVSKSDNVECV